MTARGQQIGGQLVTRLPDPGAFNPFVSRGPDGTLRFDGIDVSRVAKDFGTPIWISSPAVARHNLARLRQATREAFPHCRHAYALKANTTSNLVKALLADGCDLDVSSEAELALAQHIGVSGERLLLNGSCKSTGLLRSALSTGVGQVSIDSFDDMQLIGSMVSELEGKIRCLVRVRAEVPAQSCGSGILSILDRDDGKFGVDCASLEEVLHRLANVKGIVLCGLHVHLGFLGYADIRVGDELEVRRAVLREVIASLRAYRQLFVGRPILNLGGGMRSAPMVVVKPTRNDHQLATLLEIAPLETHIRLIKEELLRGGLLPQEIEVQFETGGFLVDTSTLMLAKVLGELRRADGKRVIMLNASTRTFVTQTRLSYPVIPLVDGDNHEPATIVGNSCAPDTLVEGWPLPRLPVGSLVALLNQGAYCETKSTQFNGLGRPGVVVIDNGRARLAKRPECWSDYYVRDEGYVIK